MQIRNSNSYLYIECGIRFKWDGNMQDSKILEYVVLDIK